MEIPDMAGYESSGKGECDLGGEVASAEAAVGSTFVSCVLVTPCLPALSQVGLGLLRG